MEMEVMPPVHVDIFGKSHVKQNQLAHSTTDFEVVSGILNGIHAYNTPMDAAHSNNFQQNFLRICLLVTGFLSGSSPMPL
eukprot:scaffold4212_cov67-Cyclotella_meneghiniana.AAC.3